MSKHKAIQERILRAIDAFKKDLEHENDLQAILRGHIYIEHEIEKLLDLALVDPKMVFGGFGAFKNKLNLAVGLGLINKDDYKSYVKITDIRNKYAHNLDYMFTREDLNTLLQSFSPALKEEYEMNGKKNSFYTDSENIALKLRGIIALLWSHMMIIVDKEERKFILEQIYIMKGIGKVMTDEEFSKLKKMDEAIDRGEYIVPLIKELKRMNEQRYYANLNDN